MGTILGLCRSLDETAFAAGETLLAEGGSTGLLYVLIEGEVEILKGDFRVDTVAEPGAIFGEISALIGIPHMATVRAIAPTRVYRVERAVEFFAESPEVALEVARLLAARLNSVTNYLVDVKRQFEGHQGHLGIVDEVLETIVHQQRQPFTPGSNRIPDPEM
ncbi:MAG: cyclic nucleotide-binding domain-containing protein [Acidobacteriota bacterium]